MILPLYRLTFSIYPTLSHQQQLEFGTHLRKNFKRFMCFPSNTSSRLCDLLIGDPHQTIMKTITVIRMKTKQRLKGLIVDRREFAAAALVCRSRTLNFPQCFTKIVQLSYSNKCSIHKHILNNAHMTSSHQSPDYYNEIVRYQSEQTKADATSRFCRIHKNLKELCNTKMREEPSRG